MAVLDSIDTVPLRLPMPKGRALRLVGVLGLVAQIVIVAFQWGTYLVQRTTLTEPPANPLIAALPLLQVAAIVVVLVAAWRSRRTVVIGFSTVLLALTLLRLGANLAATSHAPRELVAWVTSALPMVGATVALALGFLRYAGPISAREHRMWAQTAPVGAVVLSLLTITGPRAPVPHAWTLLYAVMIGVVVAVDLAWSRDAPSAPLQTGTTWRALTMLALFMIPVQAKDLLLPVNGRPSVSLVVEVAATLLMATVAWMVGAARDDRWNRGLGAAPTSGVIY